METKLRIRLDELQFPTLMVVEMLMNEIEETQSNHPSHPKLH
jgi:hypothetical protein